MGKQAISTPKKRKRTDWKKRIPSSKGNSGPRLGGLLIPSKMEPCTIGRSNPSPKTTIVRIERMLVHLKSRGTGDDNHYRGLTRIQRARVLNWIRRPRLLVLSSQDMVFGVSNDHLGKILQTSLALLSSLAKLDLPPKKTGWVPRSTAPTILHFVPFTSRFDTWTAPLGFWNYQRFQMSIPHAGL